LETSLTPIDTEATDSSEGQAEGLD
jgi:hypothetical protein